jgi:purine-binding chemotaxis protein CheW
VNGLYLFATVAGVPIAVDTNQIEAVVKLQALSKIPGVESHIAGLTALRSRVLTVIDMAALIYGAQDGEERSYAIVCDVSGHSYGFLVDRVIDISQVDAPPGPSRGSPDPVWEKHASGVIIHEGNPHYLLCLGNLIENSITAQAA